MWVKETTTAQTLSSDAQIERMEKELFKMRTSLSNNIRLIEQRDMSTHIEYKQLTLQAKALREELHDSVGNILNGVDHFKRHVQKGLKDYESYGGLCLTKCQNSFERIFYLVPRSSLLVYAPINLLDS